MGWFAQTYTNARSVKITTMMNMTMTTTKKNFTLTLTVQMIPNMNMMIDFSIVFCCFISIIKKVMFLYEV